MLSQYSRAQGPGATSLWGLNMVGTQHGTYILSSFWHLEFCSGSFISGKLVPSCLNNLRIELHNTNLPVVLLSHCILKCFSYKQFI